MHKYDFPELTQNHSINRLRMWLPALLVLGSGLLTGAAIFSGGNLRAIQAGSTAILGFVTVYWMFAAGVARRWTVRIRADILKDVDKLARSSASELEARRG